MPRSQVERFYRSQSIIELSLVYKKTDDTYMLKMKTSREFYSKVSKQFGPMPFNIRNMEDEKKARMGVVECVTHRLIEPFQVLFDKEGDKLRTDELLK